MTCPECGQHLPDSVNFCSNCGAALRATVDSTRVIPVVPVEEHTDLSDAHLAALADVPRGTGVLLVVRGANEGATYVLDSETVTAGRHPQCDIFLDDVTVSRHHAKVTVNGGRAWIADLNSLNGTYVNRHLIEGELALRPGDEVQIGKFRLVYLIDQAGQE